MNIMKKMNRKAKDNGCAEGVTIAFLGDSVTQGCFELYRKKDNSFETVFDKNHAYHTYVAEIFTRLYPTVPVNIINAGISGDNATGGLERLERDVLRHEPDLVVVCYGLNDATEEEGSLEKYVDALSRIFDKLIKSKTETIFMTPNMMNTGISDHLSDKDLIEIATAKGKLQTSGRFEEHIEAAKTLCSQYSIPVCDCYQIWKRMYENGIDVTELLANKINHPTREMNFIFSYELVKTMMD